MTDWSKYSKAENSCKQKFWDVPEWATAADPQTSSSQPDLSSRSGASPFDLYKQPGKETPICWDTRRLGTENLFAESAPLIHSERPLFQCQIIPGDVKPSDLQTLFYATLGGLGVARAYSRYVRNIYKEGSEEIAYRVYELRERFKNGNELVFEVQVDSSGKTTLIGQASFIDHSNQDKTTRYEIRKPDPLKNWHLEVDFPDGKLTQNFMMEYPQGPDKPGRVRLSISRDQPPQAFVVKGTTKFRIASARFLATDSTQAQPAKPVTLEYLEPPIPLKQNQGAGSYQFAHLSNGDVATIYTSDDLTRSDQKASFVHRFPTDKQSSHFPLKSGLYPGSSTTTRYLPTQSYPFEFAIESGNQTVGQLQLMPNFSNSVPITPLNHMGTITAENAKKGIQLRPTPITALLLVEDGNQSLIGEFTGEIFGLRIHPDHPLKIQGELQNGIFKPTFPNRQPQQLQAVVYDADGRSFSAPLTVELHPGDEGKEYYLEATYGSGKNGDPGRTVKATPFSKGNLFAIATANQQSGAEQDLISLAEEVGYSLPDKTNGTTNSSTINPDLLQQEMNRQKRNISARSFFSVTVEDANANVTRSDGINFFYHGQIPAGSGNAQADFFSVDLGAGKRLELAGILDADGTKFTPHLVRYFTTADGEPRIMTTAQTDTGVLRIDDFDKLYQSVEFAPAVLSHLAHGRGTREEAQAKILFREKPFSRPKIPHRPAATSEAAVTPATSTRAVATAAAMPETTTDIPIGPGVTLADGAERRRPAVVPPAALGTPASLLPTTRATANGGFLIQGARGIPSQPKPAPAASILPPPASEPLCEAPPPDRPEVTPPAAAMAPEAEPNQCVSPTDTSSPSPTSSAEKADPSFASEATRLQAIQAVAAEFDIDPATLWDTEGDFPRGMNLAPLSKDERHYVYGRRGSPLKIEFDLPVRGSLRTIVPTLKITYNGEKIPFRHHTYLKRPYLLLEGPLQGTVFYVARPGGAFQFTEATHPIIREVAEQDIGFSSTPRPKRNRFDYPEVRENFLSLSPEQRTEFENKMAAQIQRNRELIASRAPQEKRVEETRADEARVVIRDFIDRAAQLLKLPPQELGARILAGITGTAAAADQQPVIPPAGPVCEEPLTETPITSEPPPVAPLVCEEAPPPAVAQSGVVAEPSTSDPVAPLVCEEAASAAEARRETPTTFRESLRQEIEQHQRRGGDPIDRSHIEKLLSLVKEQSDDPVLKGWIGAIEKIYQETPETRNMILHEILSLYGRPETNIEERSSIEQLVLAGLDEVFFLKEEQLERLRPPAVEIERKAREAMKTKRVEEAQTAFRENLRQEMANIPESPAPAILESHIQRAISLIKAHPYDPVLKGWILAIEETYKTTPQARNILLHEMLSLYVKSEQKTEGDSSVERLVLSGLRRIYRQERTQSEQLEKLRTHASEREKEARKEMEKRVEALMRDGI